MGIKVATSVLWLVAGSAAGFSPSQLSSNKTRTRAFPKSAMTGSATMVEPPTPEALYQPKERDAYYGSPLNAAKYLVDLHDARATFDFCGGMMFQLILSDSLREHLVEVAGSSPPADQKPIVYNEQRMFQIPGYTKSAFADNIQTFHGREVRKVDGATGGMGFAIHLSLANDAMDDPEGWTKEEVGDYDGWGHDVGRTWRDGKRLEQEGFSTYRSKFGADAFGLHHRFYLHYDNDNRLWLSAEDGCEGTPSQQPQKRGWFF